jgi:phage terminase small subunit
MGQEKGEGGLFKHLGRFHKENIPQSTVSDIEVTFVSADGEKTASFGAREPDKG